RDVLASRTYLGAGTPVYPADGVHLCDLPDLPAKSSGVRPAHYTRGAGLHRVSRFDGVVSLPGPGRPEGHIVLYDRGPDRRTVHGDSPVPEPVRIERYQCRHHWYPDVHQPPAQFHTGHSAVQGDRHRAASMWLWDYSRRFGVIQLQLFPETPDGGPDAVIFSRL